MRFGQVIYNPFWQMPETKKTGEGGIDMYYVEDDAFERRLDEVIREGWQSPKPNPRSIALFLIRYQVMQQGVSHPSPACNTLFW